jgi:putative glycosyltransferase (TIGR04372 family)
MTSKLAWLFERLRQKGVRGTLAAVRRRLLRPLAWFRQRGYAAALLTTPAAAWYATSAALARQFVRLSHALVVLAFRALRIRFLVNQQHLFPWFLKHIGHLAVEVDCFIKEGRQGLRPPYRGVIVLPATPVANRCLLDYWRQYVYVISSPLLCRLLAPLAAQPELRYSVDDYCTAMYATGRYGKIQSANAGRPPLLQLTASHAARGKDRLRQLGVPEGAWFVCVHCREPGYDSGRPEHRARNARIDDYHLAMQAIVARGGRCIRMGDPTMRPLPPMPGVVDYAHSPLRCDWMDVFLCASSRFMLASASGLCAVAAVFGVPSAVANQALPTFALGYHPADLLIPKLLWSEQQKRHLTFPEVAGSAIANLRLAHCLDLANLTVQDNTPEDICDLALEMLDELEGCLVETEDDRRLQAAMLGLYRPGHYGYGAISRVGRRFLSRYRHLLEGTGSLPCPQTVPGCGTMACPCHHVPNWVATQKRAAG